MNDQAWQEALSTYSSTRESVLEHRFLGDLGSELWRRGRFDFAVSHSEVDNSGYDVIVESQSVVRHIQLKGVSIGGNRTWFGIQARLQEKPSACVIVMMHDPVTLRIDSYRWFGAEPNHPMPGLGEKLVKHTKGDSTGHKAERPALRELKLSSFKAVDNIASLTTLLFGRAIS